MQFIRSLVFLALFITTQTFALTQTQQDVVNYINKQWDKLTRSYRNLSDLLNDTKITDKNIIIYVPRDENLLEVQNIILAYYPKNVTHQLSIEYLPADIHQIKKHGLLYLPCPYIVPGGRFNEMYGWDSYFIELGLLASHRYNLAKNMVDNLVYEINHYGKILNANRTYYLERSQPPLLTLMILANFSHTRDTEWLKSVLPAALSVHHYWTTPPHLIPQLGLSRYYAFGHGPNPEESPSYYEKVLAYYQTHNIVDYDKARFYNKNKNQLTDLFYVADRTVRESGLDISAKYGPFGAAIIDYAPVDLNVFIYQMEKDIAQIYSILGNNLQATAWEKKALQRAEAINKYLWNDSLGYYFDYNFLTQHSRPYIYATTFYPLWAGIPSEAQAKTLYANLPNLLAAGGIVTSAYQTQLQWDAPFGWAPMQYFAMKGFARYGYHDAARTIAKRFTNVVNKGFLERRTIFEKYDVQSLSTQTSNKIHYSYSSNEPGFGWTNAVYLEMLNYL